MEQRKISGKVVSIDAPKSPTKPVERRSKNNVAKPTSLSKTFDENDPETSEVKKLNKRISKVKEDKGEKDEKKRTKKRETVAHWKQLRGERTTHTKTNEKK